MLARMTTQHTRLVQVTANALSKSDDVRRRIELQRLLPLWPQEIADLSVEGRRRVVRLLARALRQERCRGAAGHWAYDLARHAALARIWRRELEALDPICSGERRGALAPRAQPHFPGKV